jgi:hypothetical protein
MAAPLEAQAAKQAVGSRDRQLKILMVHGMNKFNL